MTQEAELREMRRALRKMLSQKRYPLIYGTMEENRYTNCYAYAFDVVLMADDVRFFGFLGWTIGKYEWVTSPKEAISLLKIDVKCMGKNIEECENAEIPQKGYKIASFLMPTGDFHFMRQDEDGTWSEKDGYEGNIRKVVAEDETPILPEEVTYKGGEAVFLGYFHIY